MTPTRRLLLFDIDGTLVDTGGVGLGALEGGFFAAFPELSSQPFPRLDLGGATDNGVAMFLFEHFGVEDSPESRERFFAGYTRLLDERLSDAAATGPGRALPGAADLLQALKSDARYDLAVLTGNTRDGAWIKLTQFALDSYFTFGSFGDDHHDRNRLGPIALERAAIELGHTFEASQVAIIGDTPKDIACARAFGAKVLAVATGAASAEVLADSAPDHLLDDFVDLETTLAALDALF